MEMRSSKIAAEADRSSSVSAMPPSHRQPPRWKAGATKAWLVVSESGESHIEEVGKHSIMRRTGLRARDLRILDPMISYPSTVLGRRRAIVVNLEHIKAIVTAAEALVLSSKNPQVTAFVENLQYHVSNHHRTPRQAAESSDTDMGVTNKDPSGSPSFLSHDESESPSPRNEISVESSTMISEMKDRGPDSTWDVPNGAGAKVLPFEFRVLEVCLQGACKCLESETSLLEKEAYPALDELTSKISTLNLERVRQIKSRLVTTSVRVQKMRDELEHLLDDDMDMAEMYLTDKLDRQHLEETSMSELDDEALDAEDESIRDEDFKSKAKSCYESLGGSKPNIEELEMLLEAYFTQIEGTLSKLSTLREYVDDTEDYIKIMLDDKQNQLLQMGAMLNTANLILTAAIVVVGILSINMSIDVFKAGNLAFSEATVGIAGGCAILYIMAIRLFKKIGLFS